MAPEEPPPDPRLRGWDDPTPPRPALVMVELSAEPGMSREAAVEAARGITGFRLDEEFDAVPMGERTDRPSIIVRGELTDPTALSDLEASGVVIGVFRDAPVEPF